MSPPRLKSPRPLIPWPAERDECFVVVTPALARQLTRFGLAREPTEEDLYQAAKVVEEQKMLRAIERDERERQNDGE